MVGEHVPGGSLPMTPTTPRASAHDARGGEDGARERRHVLPEVNDILWLSDKRWRAVAGLDAFTGVTALHLENNRIGPTLGDGLQTMRKLSVLHLSGNALTSVDDAQLARRHPSLVSVSLAGNRVERVANGTFPNSLRQLTLAKNRLRDASAIEALTRLPDLETLDLSENELAADADDSVLGVLAEFPSPRALNLRGNPLVSSLGLDHRRALVSALPCLTCLDDKAVSTMERLGAEAWRRGQEQAGGEGRQGVAGGRAGREAQGGDARRRRSAPSAGPTRRPGERKRQTTVVPRMLTRKMKQRLTRASKTLRASRSFPSGRGTRSRRRRRRRRRRWPRATADSPTRRKRAAARSRWLRRAARRWFSRRVPWR